MRGLGRTQLAGDEDPWPGKGGRCQVQAGAGEVREHLAPHIEEVRAAASQRLVVQCGVTLRDAIHRRLPGRGGAPSALEDRRPDRGQQRVIAEEQQLRLEDLRRGASRADGHGVARRPDLAGGPGQRGLQRRPLRLRIGRRQTGLRVRRRKNGAGRLRRRIGVHRADGDARRRRDPPERPACAAAAAGEAFLRGPRFGVGCPALRMLADGPRQRVERGLGAGTGRGQQDLVPLPDPEGDHRVDAPGVRGAAARGEVPQGDVGIPESAGGLHERGCGAGVQAGRIPHAQAPLVHLAPGAGRRCGAGLPVFDGRFHRRLGGPGAEMRRLRRQRAARLRQDLRQRAAEPGLDRGGDRSLHQRRLAQDHVIPPLRRQQVQRQFGAQHRAAEVHQDDHAVIGVDRLDGTEHEQGVGAQRLSRQIQPARGGQGEIRAAHPARQLRDPFGQPRAVGNDDQSDHHASRFSLQTSQHPE